jgi:predicted O-linked N-acetylglucosamine transferase (SPINDLY family)
MAAAVAHHQAGRLAEAETIYRQVLATAPEYAEALHLLGILAGQVGKPEAGVELIRAAIRAAEGQRVAPAGQARFCSNLGNLLLSLGRMDEAVESYRQAVRLDPAFAEGWVNLSIALRTTGNIPEAVAAAREAVRLGAQGPGSMMLGVALALKGGREALAEAIACFQRALQSMPGNAEAEGNLAYALREAGRSEESVTLCRQILTRRPTDVVAWKNLGLALDALGRMDEAMEAYRQALALPGGERVTEAWSGLGNDLMRRGEVEEAITCFEKAVAAHPKDSWVHSNLLFALHLDPRVDARSLFAAHQEWARRHAQTVPRFSHANPREQGKRLRIGYVSADFRTHPVGRFMLPIIKGHVARGEMDVALYSDARFGDEVTAEFRRVVEGGGGLWREISDLTDAAAADLVHRDGVDVLVDLSMHAGHNRMLLFARKPAPVQVTYLAYPGTTGMDAMDWRLSDSSFDPPPCPGQVADPVPQEGIYSERTWRLRSYWCYTPPCGNDLDTIDVPPLPAAKDRVVTFGCLNNFTKVGRNVVEAWGQILRQTNARGISSRLLVHAKDGSHRQRVLGQLAAYGVGPDRVEFAARLSLQDYLALYQRIDVGLDPFPYCGGTTTCDALWMGVPVVTLRAPTTMPAVGRGGTSLLSALGLEELVAANVDDYVRIAVELAGVLTRMTQLRAGMRSRMAASPLMDVAGFVSEIEQAYRGMWAQE